MRDSLNKTLAYYDRKRYVLAQIELTVVRRSVISTETLGLSLQTSRTKLPKSTTCRTKLTSKSLAFVDQKMSFAYVLVFF